MEKLHVFVLCVTLLKFVWSAEGNENVRLHEATRNVNDPISNIMSNIGNLILDVDKGIAVATAPKVEFESSLASQMLGPLQARREYFDRIQQNYRTFQNRLGSLFSDVISSNRNGALNQKDSASDSSDGQHDAIKGRSIDPISISPHTHGEMSRGNLFIDPVTMAPAHEHEFTREKPVDIVPKRYHKHSDRFDPEEEIRKALERAISDAERTRKSLLRSGTFIDDGSVLFRRNGDVVQPVVSDSQGRIIGDVLYSESRFDKFLRQMIRDHGKWVLDNPLLQSWRRSRKSSENIVDETLTSSTTTVNEEETSSTEDFSTEEITTQALPEIEQATESENDKSQDYFNKRSESVPLMSENYYRISDDGSVIDEVDIVLVPETIVDGEDAVYATESDSEIIEAEVDQAFEDAEAFEDEVQEPEDTIILAFTSDGIPLKLRMGPEILNPVKYLHNVLQSAGVTLKVPVESYEDPDPVGRDVLLLGSQSNVITRTVNLDLSNRNELKSLLRTLDEI